MAAVGGAALPPGNPTLTNLVAALQSYGNPHIAVYAAVASSKPLFGLSADLRYDPAYARPPFRRPCSSS